MEECPRDGKQREGRRKQKTRSRRRRNILERAVRSRSFLYDLWIPRSIKVLALSPKKSALSDDTDRRKYPPQNRIFRGHG
ncbi:hypothetical protein CEXT_619001 [Caerostris extrusa]|uniref:Uncharacterized protein n=1 Tax=Caerostris extrusa TaxID=172846 RepID=A0AAV4T3S5_CAEEX|nr:hypothetical protein CEXT_619001 [Caerostris extrusa]